MTQLSPVDISHLAKLARLSLSEEENAKFSEQLPQILNFVDQLQKADIGDFHGFDTVRSLESLRDDEVGSDSLTTEQLEKLAPYWQDNQVEVPPVFGESDDV